MYTIGVDVAYCNDVSPTGTGSVDGFRAMKAGGVEYAFIKVSQGNTIYDVNFEDHWAGAKEAGLLRGAYHVYHPAVKYALQAEWIKKHYMGDGELPLVLDAEIDLGYSNDYLIGEINGLLEMLKSAFKRVIIYTGAWWWNQNMTPSKAWMSTYDYWLASYPYTPGATVVTWEQLRLMLPTTSWVKPVMGGKEALFWQWSGDKYTLPGVKGKLDVDLFKGSKNDLLVWAGINPEELTIEQRLTKLEVEARNRGWNL